MASFAYDEAKRGTLDGEHAFAGIDVRVALLKSTTTADTEKDKLNLADFTSLNEADATNYARVAMVGETVAVDNANNRGEFTSSTTTITFSSIGGASNNSIDGALFYKHVDGTDANDVNLFYVDLKALNGAVSVETNGSDIVLTMNAQGWAQIT